MDVRRRWFRCEGSFSLSSSSSVISFSVKGSSPLATEFDRERDSDRDRDRDVDRSRFPFSFAVVS